MRIWRTYVRAQAWRRAGLTCWMSLSVLSALGDAAEVQSPRVVYAEPGKFAGWPANHGMWHWGDELLVGFSIGAFEADQPGHAISRTRPEHHVLARSRDGGRHWKIERPAARGMLVHQGGMRKGTMPPGIFESPPRPLEDPLPLGHPDFCMTLRLSHIHGGDSRLYYSTNRGRDWRGPFAVPRFGQPGVMARTDYVVTSDSECYVFLTVSKQNGREGRVLATRMRQGGRSWKALGFVGPEPRGFRIMPASAKLGPQRWLVANRRRAGDEGPRRRWIDLWRSDDDGLTWTQLPDPVDDLGEGNPPAMLRLRDGRICLTYGVRADPYPIVARISTNEGRSFGPPIRLRQGGGGADHGYVRTVERPDGWLVSVYYYLAVDSPFPRIEAVVWRPDAQE